MLPRSLNFQNDMPMQTTTINRDRINDTIDTCLHSPVLCISAPMGYGKSTAVHHYLQERMVDHIWVSALYNDDVRLWKHLCDAIAAKRDEAGQQLRAIGFPVARYYIPQIIEAFNSLAKEPLIIVLDDCHLLAEESPLYHVILALALEQIEKVRIICIARRFPTWLLAEMCTKEVCACINADTLTFNRPEVLAYLRLRKVTSCAASAQAAASIWEASEGWAAAIVLLAEGLRRGREVIPLENTYGLFEHTFFQPLPPKERVLLMQLSVADMFTLEQAEYILQNSDIKQIIVKIYKQGTFITWDVTSNTYKIHAMLREFLANKAIICDVSTQNALLHLARWEYAQENYGAALRHYHQCGQCTEFFERVTREERIHIAFGYQQLCYDIFSSMPIDAALQFPRLYIFLSLYFLSSGISERERFAMKCIGILRRNFAPGASNHPQSNRIITELRIVLHVAQFNDPFRTMDLSNCIDKDALLEVVGPVASTVSLSAGLPSLLHCLYRKAGKLEAIIAFAEKNFDCDCLGGLGYGFDKLLHAEKHFERCELDKARFCAEQAIHKGWLREQMYIVASAHVVLMRIALMEGKSEEAAAQLDSIKFAIPKRLSFRLTPDVAQMYSRMAVLCEMMAYSMKHNAEQLALCVPNIDTIEQDYLYCGIGMPTLFRIKYNILIGNFAVAEVLCDHYEKQSTRYPSQLGLLRYKIFRAVVNAHLYGVDAALTPLYEALTEAAQDEVTAPFAENAAFILTLLESISPSEHLSELFLSRVRAVCLHSGDILKQQQPPPGTGLLTRREIEVFRLLAKGLSQKNIATTLSISIPTVKRHLGKIYAKLEVNNRVAALNKWLALGF